MPHTIRDWIDAKVVGISKQEIIESYTTYNGRSNISRKTRARLTVIDDESPPAKHILVVSMQQDDGRWTERRGVMRWSMGKYLDRKELYDAFVVTTNLTYAGWTNADAGKGMVGFLRIGPQGAIFLMPSGKRTTIANPPDYKGPPTHLRSLHVGSDGFLAHTETPNPLYDDWQTWEREVSETLDYCRRRAAQTGMRIDPQEYAQSRQAICQLCGIHANQAAKPQANWRIVDQRFYCDVCNMTRGKQ